MMLLTIRKAILSDICFIADLFYNTIQAINSKDYSPKQIEAWALGAAESEKWIRKIGEQYFIVATSEEERIVGFASLTGEGYLDYMFVHKDYQGMGIAQRLLNELERQATVQGCRTICSDVSITAKPFFERNLFVVEQEQCVTVRGAEMINYRMTKEL